MLQTYKNSALQQWPLYLATRENHRAFKFPGCSSVYTNGLTCPEMGPWHPYLLGYTHTGLRMTLSRTMTQCGLPLATHRKESTQIVWWLGAVLGPWDPLVISSMGTGGMLPRRGEAWKSLSMWELLPRVWGQAGPRTLAITSQGCGHRWGAQ